MPGEPLICHPCQARGRQRQQPWDPGAPGHWVVEGSMSVTTPHPLGRASPGLGRGQGQ